MRAVLAAARRSAGDGLDPRHTLWQAWNRSGLQRRWLAVSERGGPAGAQADRDLDAVTALFDVAEQYVTRTAGASLRGLIDHVAALGLPTPPASRVRQPDAVAVLSAHAALGPGMGTRRHRRTAGRVVAQHHSTRRRARHPAAVDVLDGIGAGGIDQGAAAGRGTQIADRGHGPCAHATCS